MGCLILKKHVFVNNVATPVTSNPYPCDYRFTGEQNRTFFVTMASGANVSVQGTSDFEVTAATVFATVTAVATAGAGGTTTQFVINGPYGCLRVVKGGNTAATVVGIV